MVSRFLPRFDRAHGFPRRNSIHPRGRLLARPPHIGMVRTYIKTGLANRVDKIRNDCRGMDLVANPLSAIEQFQ